MFSLSLKSKYGLAALFQLALKENDGPVQIKTISQLEGIPHNYLEQVLIDLKRGGFVKSLRGAKGGYLLSEKPEFISIKNILTCLEGPSVLSSKICNSSVLSSFWKNIESNISDQLQVSLKDLVKKQQELDKITSYSI